MYRRHGSCVVNYSKCFVNTIDIGYFCQVSDLEDDAESRIASKLSAISQSQQALIRIRPLTLMNHFLGQGTDVIDSKISTALLHFENKVSNSFFRLSEGESKGSPEIIVLIAGTPRTGNSITRLMVNAMGFIEYMVHSLNDLDINSLKNRCVIQCHADAQTINSWKKEFNVKVVTLVRNPLDVLESMRKYAPKNIEAKYWGITRSTHEIKMMGDPKQFYRWAISRDARRLMNLSLDVAKNTETKVIRYEELVSNPRETFDAIAGYIGGSYLEDVEQTLEAKTKLLPSLHITHGGPGAGADVKFAHKVLVKFVYRKLFRALKY
jgi:hypothetical protein